jgi:hypothetical protein
MTPDQLEDVIDEVERLNLQGLRDTWRRYLGALPPVRSRDLLRRMLAFELQARVYGGLSPELKRKLRRGTSAKPPKASLQPGTMLIREWRGERHTVHVLPEGFEHLGNRYKSLSEVARAITGARWSGPRFFGLNDAAKPA